MKVPSQFNDILLILFCKFCDEIAVFDHGEVIQQGTHEHLLADTAGKYYELWNAQAQYYTEEPA